MERLATIHRTVNNPPMPRNGMIWRHVIINTRSSWLPGDERGFRSRRDRIHSSGDYRNPPPQDEHAGLRIFNERNSGDEITIPRHLRSVIGRAIVAYLISQNYRVLVVAVAKVHAHFIVELPIDLFAVRWIVGQAKRKSSRAVKDEMPGSIWAAGGTYKPVENRKHMDRAYPYVLYEQGSDAWTWSFEDGNDAGCYGRKRT
jgi:hypothetical protein